MNLFLPNYRSSCTPWISCTKGKMRYPPESDSFKLCKDVQKLVKPVL